MLVHGHKEASDEASDASEAWGFCGEFYQGRCLSGQRLRPGGGGGLPRLGGGKTTRQPGAATTPPPPPSLLRHRAEIQDHKFRVQG